MKKLLSLALIVLSCLAFASCDAVQQLVPGLDLGGGSKPTISEDEWLELVSETNYSSNYTYYENQDGELVATVNFERKYDNTTSYEKRIENGEISYEEYITVMDNKGYSIYDNNDSDGFVLHLLDSIPEPTPLMSETNAKKCYQYLKETDNNTYTIKYKSSDAYTLEYVIELQDGKIVSMTETYTHKNGDDKMETKFFDISTTVIEIPEYSNGDNGGAEEVRTTITKEEWLSAINSTNFSMVGNNYNSNGDVIMIQSMYFSETAALVYSWAEIGDTLTENAQYTAIIDGVGYTITKEDSGYVGVAADTTVEKLEIKLCQANASVVDSWENLYDTFVYDEESKTYKANCTYSGNEATFEAFFEDGKVIKFEIKFVKYGNNCTVTYSNFGNTVIEIPEFVLAE